MWDFLGYITEGQLRDSKCTNQITVSVRRVGFFSVGGLDWGQVLGFGQSIPQRLHCLFLCIAFASGIIHKSSDECCWHMTSIACVSRLQTSSAVLERTS